MSDDKARTVTVPATVAEQLSAVANVLRKYTDAAAPGTELAEAGAVLDLITADLHASEADLGSAALRRNIAYQEVFIPAPHLLKPSEFPLDAFLITDRFGVIQEANHAAAYLLQTR